MKAPEPNTLIQQELVNSIVHGFGIILGIVGIPILIAFAIKSDNTPGVIGAAIYGFCFFTTFYFFHALPRISTCPGKARISNP
ncbi:AdipoR/hemolysin III family protein [Maribacter polysiphoniae]|uniref:hypothetical protein n=1 Tax=Maribacter polysiphoniae TaxID=429344 RepID=UPI001CBB46F7|nr:hypothetical protein [Maribacter polysiphoniae]